MLIDKKGRLFGKINLLDALIVLILVVAILLCAVVGFTGGPGFLKGGSDSEEEGIKTEILYTVEIPKEEAEYFEKIKVGDEIFNPTTDEVIGEIVECDIRPAKYMTENKADLRYEMVEVEGRYDGYIKIKSEATFDYPDFKMEKESIKIGTFVKRETNLIAMEGHIVDIEYDESLIGGEENDN